MSNTVITIARSYGSGGRTLGKLLAKELGINYYDRELIRMASDESGINEALFGEVDEKLKKSPLKHHLLCSGGISLYDIDFAILWIFV